MSMPVEMLIEPPPKTEMAGYRRQKSGVLARSKPKKSPVDFWHAPAVIAENNFIYKSLSNWAFNVAVGCSHACRFCYVPSAATIKQGPKLAEYGVKDPDAEWGDSGAVVGAPRHWGRLCRGDPEGKPAPHAVPGRGARPRSSRARASAPGR